MKRLFTPLTAAEPQYAHREPVTHPSLLRSPLAFVHPDYGDLFMNYRAHTERLAAVLFPAALLASVGVWAAVQVLAR